MKKFILIGRSECGKTTLTQALRGEELHYQKTQTISNDEFLIDTPGEYIQNRLLGGAIAVYAYEADIVALVLSATEPYSLYSPCITGMTNREVIGVVTKIDEKEANVQQARLWLQIAGCKKIFEVSSVTGEGIVDLVKFIHK